MSKAILEGKKVTVLGLGTHEGGVGVVRFLVSQGAEVLVSDLKDELALAESLVQLKDLPIKFSLGGHCPKIFEADLLVRNPAVPYTSPVLKEAERRGVPVVMESALFFDFCSSSKVIGVTGTKGKTTAVLLLERVLRDAGEDVVAAGNFGRSMLEILPEITSQTWVVLELSSFQLEGLEVAGKSPHIAIVTSFFPDHLDRYRDMDDYARAKEHIFKYQRAGDALFLENSIDTWDLSELKSRIIPFKGGTEPLVKSVADYLGLSVDLSSLKVAAPFRQQLVGEKNGVQFVNDSCATNPGAALYALDKFGGEAVLIAGGTDKGLDYRELSYWLNECQTPVVLLSGSATEKIKAGLRKDLILTETRNLGEAVRVAYAFALSSGRRRVLFSPAAASFELFKDEFDRGRKFDEAVRSL